MRQPRLKDFVKWLDEKPDEEVVGFRCNPTSCPCAECFRETYDEPVEVMRNHIGIVDGTRSVNSPSWLKKLVRLIDGLEGLVDDDVTAGEVRRHLVNILAKRG